MAKELYTKLEKMLEGLNETADVVSSTLGPNGRNVYIQEPYTSRISNDGARIAYNIAYSDPEKNAGANIVKNAAAKTNDDVGDGTTTTVVLLQALIKQCLTRGENPSVIRASLQEATKKAIMLLHEKSQPLHQSEVESVALVSAEYPDLAKMIAEITEKLGVDALVAIEDSSNQETSYEIADGYKLDVGLMTPWLYTDQRAQNATYEDIPVMIATKKISKVQDIKRITDALDSRGIDRCAFFVADIEESVLAVLVASKLKGNFKSVVIRITQDIVPDIASVTGARPVSDAAGTTFSTMTFNDLGVAKKIIVDGHTTLIQGDVKGAANRALELEVDASAEDNDILKSRLLERAGRLRGKIAVMKIGANSDFAREHKKDKAQDVVKAIPAAATEGLVMGAGMTWNEIANEIGSETIGEQILSNVLKVPRQKMIDSGYSDFEGIRDPAKVERVALENAVEAAGIVITIQALILDAPINNRPEANRA